MTMAKKRKNSGKRVRKKSRDSKKEMIQFIRQPGFDKETTESLIKEVEEICAFEDSLEEF
jgi:Spy/CpxP family protein refolding chaperone